MNAFKLKSVTIFLLFTVCIHTESNSQIIEKFNDLGEYIILADCPVYSCDITGKIKNNCVEIAHNQSVFCVIKKKNSDSLVVKHIKFSNRKNMKPNKRLLNLVDTVSTYLLVSFYDFERIAIPYYFRNSKPLFTCGTVLLPIKMRFKEFDFSKDFTLGPVFGLRWRISKLRQNHINLLAGIGVTSFSLDSLSTEGGVSNVSERAGITPSIGVVFSFDNIMQVGLFVGKDYVSQKEDISWKYQGKTWLSVGIGFTMLTNQIAERRR